MTKEELIIQAKRISDNVKTDIHGSMAEAKEFLNTYGGRNNSFYKGILELNGSVSIGFAATKTMAVLNSFIRYVENDLLRSISPERVIQIETVSDYLEQAEILLNDKNVHPAAPAVIIGASLEEFLRNWLIDIGADMENIHKNIDAYAKDLRSKELINKQDLKDITAWGGIRNDAAHGHWVNVEDKKRIQIMLEGVNLFIRKYSQL